jgi:hypothetical protein
MLPKRYRGPGVLKNWWLRGNKPGNKQLGKAPKMACKLQQGTIHPHLYHIAYMFVALKIIKKVEQLDSKVTAVSLSIVVHT